MPLPTALQSLLRRSRELYVGGLYFYGSFNEAPAKSLHAVEVALAHRLGSRSEFQSLINKAHERGLISEDDRDRLHDGGKLRNRFVHASTATIWTPALAAEIVAASHRAVASLFPDEYRAVPEPPRRQLTSPSVQDQRRCEASERHQEHRYSAAHDGADQHDGQRQPPNAAPVASPDTRSH